MITLVDDIKKLKRFIYFVKDLYKSDKNFANPIYFSVIKELKKEVLIKKRSTAVYCERDGKIVGRLLFSIGRSKQKDAEIGYFSYFDVIEDFGVAEELFAYMESFMRGKVKYIEGTFSPFDQDTRRGILVQGYDQPHTLFTSYNYPYYGEFLEKLGYEKGYDTYTVRIDLTEKNYNMIADLAKRHEEGKNVVVDGLDFKNFDRDLEDVHKIFQEATFELNYQDAPSIDLIRNAANSMKLFLDPDLVKIAREKDTGRPIGFCLVLKDFNEIFRRTKGKINPFAILFYKNKIKGVRGMLQYVVPDYQHTGLICLLYKSFYDSMREKKIEYFEGGTIMEKNVASWKILVKFGGVISKVYRIFQKEV